jgi:hypothetical protein
MKNQKTQAGTFKTILKNFFFINHEQVSENPVVCCNKEEQENMHDYIECYQQVTRWK